EHCRAAPRPRCVMPPATVPCPHCQSPVAVDVGQVGRCPGCGGEVRVYVERVEGPAAGPAPRSPTNPPQAPRRPRRSLLFVVLLAPALAYFMVQHYKSQQDREELRRLRDSKPDAEQDGLYRRFGEVKAGMSVEQ